MQKIIATTTINPPTEALQKFAKKDGWTLVAAGDKKTPIDWHIPTSVYLSPEWQEDYDKRLSDAIGWNCMQRRNFALLYARHVNADVVAIVDDDNIPYAHWGNDLMVGKEVEVNYYLTSLVAFDPVGATDYPYLWHRGFPLELLSQREYHSHRRATITPDVQADFWNGNPDIDAVCRMEHAPECTFQERYFPIASNVYSPFNSQNTFITGRMLKNYFLFPFIGRMDDIWAAYYLQSKGARVVYGKPSVYQQRNPHNLIHDMKNEYLGYEHNLELVKELLQESGNISKFVPKASMQAFELYQRHF